MKIVPSGPLPKDAVYANGKLMIHFNYVAAGLKTADGKGLCGFSLDGIKEVEAKIAGDMVVIETSTRPSIVYYGWSPFSEANLVNTENLPASTFKLFVK
jgi:sialate O-acetylesterase